MNILLFSVYELIDEVLALFLHLAHLLRGGGQTTWTVPCIVETSENQTINICSVHVSFNRATSLASTVTLATTVTRHDHLIKNTLILTVVVQ